MAQRTGQDKILNVRGSATCFDDHAHNNVNDRAGTPDLNCLYITQGTPAAQPKTYILISTAVAAGGPHREIPLT